MVCERCAAAADAHAPRDQHCDATPGPGAACDCQHRDDRYRTQAVTTDSTATTHEETDR